MLVCCEQPERQESQHFLGSFAEKLGQQLSIPLLLLPAQESWSGSLAEMKQPVTCLVAFVGSQPEPFLISPATVLLAALADRGPAHLHFVSLHSVLSQSDRTNPEQLVTRLYNRHPASKAGAVLLKEPYQTEKPESGREQYRTDVFVLATPLPGEDGNLLREMCAYPCLLIPSH